jgi:hypothetical protein
MNLSNEIIPIFYDHTSLKSILTPWLAEECKPNGPQSFLKLAKEAGRKQVYFVSTNFYSFIEAWKNANKMGLDLIFGLELWVCKDAKEKSEQSTLDESKVIIWIENGEGYSDLIKIYTSVFAHVENKYYHYRASWSDLKERWTPNLKLSIPFYDSFLHRNVLNHGSQIIPDFPCAPFFHREIDSGLPFEHVINEAIDKYNPGKEFEVKTRTINLHSEFDNPELQFCCSDNFSWENYKELIK